MTNWLTIETNERKNLALWLIFGGAAVMTIYAAAVLWLVHLIPQYAFWLGIAAHVQIVLVLTALAAQLVKRRVSVGKDGFSINDSGDELNAETRNS